MKIIIVEDEFLAQQELTWLIKTHSQMEIVGTFDDGLDVLKFLQHNRVDAIFLDINIPSLDGVLLAARAGTLQREAIGFDEDFDFHFYDLDFCRCARALGLRLGTWPIRITHRSGGGYGSPAWREGYRKYIAKWGIVDLPPADSFQPARSRGDRR